MILWYHFLYAHIVDLCCGYIISLWNHMHIERLYALWTSFLLCVLLSKPSSLNLIPTSKEESLLHRIFLWPWHMCHDNIMLQVWPASPSSLQPLPHNSSFSLSNSWSLFFTNMLLHSPRHISIIFSVCIILLLYMFPCLTIWYWVIS